MNISPTFFPFLFLQCLPNETILNVANVKTLNFTSVEYSTLNLTYIIMYLTCMYLYLTYTQNICICVCIYNLGHLLLYHMLWI